MNNTIQKFDFYLSEVSTVEARIVLMNYSKLKDGRIAITAGMTELEIDTNIQLLKDDLDRVGKIAKAAVRKAKASRKM